MKKEKEEIKQEKWVNKICINSKMAVFGSRSLRDERVKILLLEWIEKYKPSHIVTCQEPEGVSEVAQKVAKEMAIPLILHFLNFRYLRGAFARRSQFIIAESDFFVIVHDGESKGTENEFKQAQKSGKPFIYVRLKKTKYKRSVGFNIKDEWNEKSDGFQVEDIKI